MEDRTSTDYESKGREEVDDGTGVAEDSFDAEEEEVGAHRDGKGVEDLDNDYQGVAIFDWEDCKGAQRRK